MTDNNQKETSNCSEACECHSVPENKGFKTLVCCVALVLVLAIVGYKLSAKEKTAIGKAPGVTKTGFIAPENRKIAAPENAVDKVMTVESKLIMVPQEGAQIGEYLASFSTLDQVGRNYATVFIFVPAENQSQDIKKTKEAMLNAQMTLDKNAIKVGLFTLLSSAPEYKDIRKQVNTQSVIVATKGRGMNAVSGEITESKLLQAFTATNTSGCGTGSSCGPSGCK